MLDCRPNGVSEITIKTGPYCGVAAHMGSNNDTDNATLAMQACWLDAPIISLSNSCDIYCNALSQTTDELMNCLLQTFSRDKGNMAGVLCQRAGSSAGSQTARPLGFAKVVVLAEVLWIIAYCGLQHVRL
jgi:hypothetical protein